MQSGTHKGNGTTTREVVSGIKVIESEYRVLKPVFKDVEIERAVFHEKKIEIPVGHDDLISDLTSIISKQIVTKVLDDLNAKLDTVITDRLKQVEVPEIIYKKVEKIIETEKVNFKYTEVINPIMVDKEIINPIIKDVEVQNAILKDVVVEKPVWQEKVVIQPKFEEVVIQKPKYVDRDIVVIHPKYIDMQGNPEPA